MCYVARASSLLPESSFLESVSLKWVNGVLIAMADASNNSCRVCGKEANDECSSCHDALYCSVSCQKRDWKILGHKPLCRGPELNRKIRNIVQDLFATEWQWLRGLSSSEKAKFFSDEILGAPLNHLFRGGEVALVLTGTNACAELFHPFCRSDYGSEYYKKVLLPWYDRHRTFLKEQGFFVKFIDHPVYVKKGEDIMTFRNFGIIGNSNSSKSQLVYKVFTNQRIPISFFWSTDEAVTIHDIVECLSFRTTRVGDQTSGSGVEYIFQFPEQVFGGAEVCCSSCLEMRPAIDPADANALGEHFFQCYCAMSALGFSIQLYLRHASDWPDDAIARAFWAACGKDSATFDKWMKRDKDGPLCWSASLLERLDGIIDLVYEMPD